MTGSLETTDSSKAREGGTNGVGDSSVIIKGIKSRQLAIISLYLLSILHHEQPHAPERKGIHPQTAKKRPNRHFNITGKYTKIL